MSKKVSNPYGQPIKIQINETTKQPEVSRNSEVTQPLNFWHKTKGEEELPDFGRTGSLKIDRQEYQSRQRVIDLIWEGKTLMVFRQTTEVETSYKETIYELVSRPIGLMPFDP